MTRVPVDVYMAESFGRPHRPCQAAVPVLVLVLHDGPQPHQGHNVHDLHSYLGIFNIDVAVGQKYAP